MRALLICLLIAGCATVNERPIKIGEDTKAITLVRTYSATEECGKVLAPRPGWKIIACATMGQISCTIYAQPTIDDDVLGHETRHCFDGEWHR